MSFDAPMRFRWRLHRASLDFPKIEQYGGLADQMRRASKSVCALDYRRSGTAIGFAERVRPLFDDGGRLGGGSADLAVAMPSISAMWNSSRRRCGARNSAMSSACCKACKQAWQVEANSDH